MSENAWLNMDEFIPQYTKEQLKMRRPKLIVVNWILIIAVIAMLISSIVKPVIAFMIGTAVALIINYHNPVDQRKLLEDKGKDAIGLTCILFDANSYYDGILPILIETAEA